MQATPLLAGLAVGAAAYAGKTALTAWQSFSKTAPRMRQFYKGGFLPEMTRREAALILGGWLPLSERRAARRQPLVLRTPLLFLLGNDHPAWCSRHSQASEKARPRPR